MMNSERFVLCALLVGLALAAGSSKLGALPHNVPDIQPVGQAFGEAFIEMRPLQFEANEGQANATVDFIAHGQGYNVFLTPGGFEVILSAANGDKSSLHLQLQFVGNADLPEVVGLDKLPGVVNYYVGHDRSQWHTGIPTYSKVGYQGVYPGIDAIFYGNQRQVEYDFVVAPGVDPDVILLEAQGADALMVNPEGDLVIEFSGEELRLRKPTIYQEVHGVRREIPGGYRLEGKRQFGFELAAYDPRLPLFIDPVLQYATYFGGSANDYAYDIALDKAGNIYLTGATNSVDFPLANPDQPEFGGGGIDCPSDDVPYRVCYDAFVTKLNPTGTALLYSTYIGMPGDDEGHGIAVDTAGNAYIAGQMSVSGDSLPDLYVYKYALVAKLDPKGKLVYGGWFGTNGSLVRDIAVDVEGRAYLTGEANGFLTTPDAIQPERLEIVDAFVTVLNPTGDELVYSTNLGGSEAYCNLCYSSGYGIAVDSAGMIYVTGQAAASFPTTANAYQRDFDGFWKAFVVKIDRTRAGEAGLVYSTLLGGTTLSDFGYDIALDDQGMVYVTGATQTDDFPTTPGAYDRTCGTDGICNTLNNQVCDYTPPGMPPICHIDSKSDVFVAKMDLTKSGAASLIYSTYVGGGGHESGKAIGVDANGNAYVTGKTGSPNFPLVNPVQSVIGGNTDVFVFRLNAAGSGLDYATFLGGGGDDVGEGIAVARGSMDGTAYLTGWTVSSAFPEANPLQPQADGWEAFIAQIQIPTTPVLNHHLFLPFVNR